MWVKYYRCNLNETQNFMETTIDIKRNLELPQEQNVYNSIKTIKPKFNESALIYYEFFFDWKSVQLLL